MKQLTIMLIKLFNFIQNQIISCGNNHMPCFGIISVFDIGYAAKDDVEFLISLPPLPEC